MIFKYRIDLIEILKFFTRIVPIDIFLYGYKKVKTLKIIDQVRENI